GAHAFGVFGKNGGGLVEELGIHADIQMGTLSKSAGSMGGYAAGSKELIQYFQNMARSFIYTTGMPAMVAAAARVAVGIIASEPARRVRVLQHASVLRQGLRDMGFDTRDSVTPIIPVMMNDVSRAVAFSRKLLDRGIFVSAIRPPTVPEGTARLRVTVSAAHREDDIVRCLEAFRSIKNEL
ncbi:MAG: aminotransferase class I/II-fold pyridoxal phosphate-dependent enzyme, partial [Candidatus Omnitrophica bacterium]|nr:aminotransferase class I/II-fold pyridoxal phosphate-dependent enzyme [Candidatus Omnitrophota bacterium]